MDLTIYLVFVTHKVTVRIEVNAHDDLSGRCDKSSSGTFDDKCIVNQVSIKVSDEVFFYLIYIDHHL